MTPIPLVESSLMVATTGSDFHLPTFGELQSSGKVPAESQKPTHHYNVSRTERTGKITDTHLNSCYLGAGKILSKLATIGIHSMVTFQYFIVLRIKLLGLTILDIFLSIGHTVIELFNNKQKEVIALHCK